MRFGGFCVGARAITCNLNKNKAEINRQRRFLDYGKIETQVPASSVAVE